MYIVYIRSPLKFSKILLIAGEEHCGDESTSHRVGKCANRKTKTMKTVQSEQEGSDTGGMTDLRVISRPNFYGKDAKKPKDTP